MQTIQATARIISASRWWSGAAALAFCFTTLNHFAGADDWPGWRGPAGDNHADASTKIPASWDWRTRVNILWKTPIAGRGHSTPIVVGDAIFLTTSEEDKHTQSLVKLDRETGRLVQQWVIHRGGLTQEIHAHNSQASPSPAFDGERVIVVFHQNDAIVATAVTPDGEQVWQTRVADFRPARFQFGYGASPLVVDNLVIIAAEYDGKDSGLYALDTATGKQVWMVPRKSNLNFASPILATIGDQRSVLLAGADTITAYEPSTGQSQWSINATTEAICGTCVWDGDRVIVSGGNPDTGTWCVSAGGDLVWSNRVKCYEQSLLAVDGYVYGFADNGVIYCWRTSDGREMWRSRLGGGGVSASPLLVDGRLVLADEGGTMYVVAANPDRFELLQEIRTGESIFASPVAIDNRMLVRTAADVAGRRQEYLIAIGE